MYSDEIILSRSDKQHKSFSRFICDGGKLDLLIWEGSRLRFNPAEVRPSSPVIFYDRCKPRYKGLILKKIKTKYIRNSISIRVRITHFFVYFKRVFKNSLNNSKFFSFYSTRIGLTLVVNSSRSKHLNDFVRDTILIH